MGPIPPGFPARDGMLHVGGQSASDLVARAGDTPLFVYDGGLIRQKVAALRAAMPTGLAVHYAVKANPFAPLLGVMAGLVDGFDIASGGELRGALEAGMAPERISFAGPGKRDDELDAALRARVTINLESEGEAARVLAMAEGLAVRPRLAVRVNPDFELKGSGMRMGGGARPFGVDADRAGALARQLIIAGADWQGWHIFAGSQALDPDAIVAAFEQGVALAARLSSEAGAMPPLVNLGGGFGVPYFPGDEALDIARIGAGLAAALERREAVLARSQFAIELGRYLAAEAGVYLTRVVDVKWSQGERFAIVDGGLHHQLAATGNFGTVIRRNYPLALANRFDAPPDETPTTVVGCLCTPLDRLGEALALPEPQIGDLVAVFLAGAYGASASPSAFLGHSPARELLVQAD
ncbi:MAG: pyridoxal-dependent decarboxylase, exosortase A system-associated [Sphingobium sp.]|nr:pyridoxal-dependent decarboxylase, exosortase A system-associated [Sphingobium sp.]